MPFGEEDRLTLLKSHVVATEPSWPRTLNRSLVPCRAETSLEQICSMQVSTENVNTSTNFEERSCSSSFASECLVVCISLNTSCLIYEISRPRFHGDSWTVNLSTWRPACRGPCTCYVSDRKRRSGQPFTFSNASPALLEKRASCLLSETDWP
jgi:hypothetical protein